MQNKQENERIPDTVGGTVVYKADQSLRGRLKVWFLGSRRARRILLGLFSVATLCALVYGALVIIGRLPFKVGSYKVTHGDVDRIESALEKSRGKADDGDKEEAMDRAIMLAALKTEADKQKIPYGHDLIDKSLESMYQQYGGKEGYMKYMQQTHGWSEEDVYTHRTTEYLKTKLEESLIARKTFTVAYIRWDMVRGRVEGSGSGNFEQEIAAREEALRATFKDKLESGVPFAEIQKLAEFSDVSNGEQTERAFTVAQGAPTIVQSENPYEITYSKTPYGGGVDDRDFFAKATKKGQVIGIERLAGGRSVLARLESMSGGEYQSWDDFLNKARENAGKPRSKQGEKQSLLKAVLSRVSSITKYLNPFHAQAAYAAGTTRCASHQVPVSFTFRAVDVDTGASLTGGSFAAAASRNMDVCSPDDYRAQGYTITGDSGWQTVTKTVWGVPGSIDLDCVGYDWAFWAPSISGYAYNSREESGAYANGGSKTVTFKYKKNTPPPVDEPEEPTTPPPVGSGNNSCRLTAAKVGDKRYSISITTNVPEATWDAKINGVPQAIAATKEVGPGTHTAVIERKRPVTLEVLETISCSITITEGGGCTGSNCCTGTGCGTFDNCQTLGTCPPQTICEDGSYAPFGEPCTVQKRMCSLLTPGISIGSGAQWRRMVEIKRGQSIALKWQLPANRWSSGNGPVSFQIGREDGDYPIDKTGEPNATLGPTINAASPERNLNTVASNGSLLLKGDGVFSLTVAPEKTTTYRVHQQGYAQQQALAFRDYIRNPDNVNTLREKIGAVRSELQNIKNARANFTRGNQGSIQAYPFWTNQFWLVTQGRPNAQNPRSIASDVDKMTNMLTALPYSNFSDSEKWPMPTLAQTETPANNHKYFHNSYPSGYAGTMTLVQFLEGLQSGWDNGYQNSASNTMYARHIQTFIDAYTKTLDEYEQSIMNDSNASAYEIMIKRFPNDHDWTCTVTVSVDEEIPANRPYLKIDGSDVVSGAAFVDGGGTCSPTASAKAAKIQTNGFLENKDSWGSSGGQYATYASGSIGGSEQNTFLANSGYLRGLKKDLLFANVLTGKPVESAGDFYGGNEAAIPCIDLQLEQLKKRALNNGWRMTRALTTAEFNLLGGLSLSGDIYVSGDLVLDGTTNLTGAKTLIVDGSVTIKGNIAYAGSTASNQVPYLKIIADNIYIDKAVSQIDGQFVAYPRSASDGMIDTCSGTGANGAWGAALTLDSCNRRLVVNGSLTARRVLWKGTQGTVGDKAGGVFDAGCHYTNGASGCAAEYVNFSPEGYVGRFNMNADQSVSNSVSTVELPPVY